MVKGGRLTSRWVNAFAEDCGLEESRMDDRDIYANQRIEMIAQALERSTTLPPKVAAQFVRGFMRIGGAPSPEVSGTDGRRGLVIEGCWVDRGLDGVFLYPAGQCELLESNP
jgi:hypothetical protein